MKTNNSKRTKFRSFSGKMRKLMLSSLMVVVAVLILLISIMAIISPGKTKPYFSKEGDIISDSINEKVFVSINGVMQGMIIQSKDITNPVILYLHGGLPDYFLTKKYPTGLEENFTIVWWEQRGSGISYSDGLDKGLLTTDQLVKDTIAVTNYLCERFEKEKIFLMAHSGGTFIGIKAAEMKPELYFAYLGVSQISDQLNSEILAYNFMLEQFSIAGNHSMVRELEKYPVTVLYGTPLGYLKIRDKAMHILGVGTTHDMRSVFTGIFFPSLMIPEYTLSEKYYFWKAKSEVGVSALWEDMLATDMSFDVPELTIPVYFFHGVYDYTCSYPLAKEYLEDLQAPVKGFYTFENSAHSPFFEEPQRFQTILLEDVMLGLNNLAD